MSLTMPSPRLRSSRRVGSFFSSMAFILGVVALQGNALAADKPNILWITSEDHGPQMGCYGDYLARTPNIDALARRGMIFNRVWSCAPVCAPARTAIISGMYPSSTGGIHMRSMVPMPQGAKLYPEHLKEAGYYCTNNSKEDYNVSKPEGLWDDSSSRAHWRNRKEGQPFFAVFNSTKSHESQIRTRPHALITNPKNVRVPTYHPDLPEVRLDWAQYYDKVSEADADAGKVLVDLAKDGLFEDTIIFYYGDHGSGMPRSKRWPCNSGLHVPLVVYFPEKWSHLAPAEYQPGGKSDRLVNFVDLAPTILSIVGIEPPAIMQGQAFAGPFQTDPPAFLFGQRGRMDERYDFVRTVTDGRHVYIRNYFPHVSQAQHVDYQFQTPTTRLWKDAYDRGLATPEQSIFWDTPKATEELYDLKHDPDEVKNLVEIESYREVLETLRRANSEHMAKVRDVGFLPEGEIHARSQGSTPYDMAHDDAKYPYARIAAAAEFATSQAPNAGATLLEYLSDSDSAVRYWGAIGLLIRGSATINSCKEGLRKALSDPSPYVRIVAAQTLIEYASSEERGASLKVLEELAPPEKNGVFVSMAALNVIESIGFRGAPLLSTIDSMNPKGPSPDGRFDSYVPRLLQNISEKLGGKAATNPSKGKKNR